MAVGENTTEIKQLEAAASEPPQLFDSPNSPETVTLVIVSELLPRLLRVTV